VTSRTVTGQKNNWRAASREPEDASLTDVVDTMVSVLTSTNRGRHVEGLFGVHDFMVPQVIIPVLVEAFITNDGVKTLDDMTEWCVLNWPVYDPVQFEFNYKF
jgi:hypothetical protein